MSVSFIPNKCKELRLYRQNKSYMVFNIKSTIARSFSFDIFPKALAYRDSKPSVIGVILRSE